MMIWVERLRRNWAWLAAGLAVAGGLAWFFLRGSSEEGAYAYETQIVDRGRIVAKVTATGTLSALVTVQVGSQVSGRLAEILVDFNDRVNKGQVLARIDPRFYEAALEHARANVQAADGQFRRARALAEQAQSAFRRSKELSGRKLLSPADLELAQATAKSAEAEVRVAEGQLAQARAALTQASVNLGYTTIVSPINGVVISRNVDVGQTVAASLQAPTLFTIAEDLSRMQVDTSVAEADIGKLRAGMSAEFFVDAYPGERFAGSVRQLRHAPQVVQNVVTYDAVIDVANPELKLRPGMTANVTFVHAERESAVRVPNAATRLRAPDAWLAKYGAGSRPPGADGARPPGGANGTGRDAEPAALGGAPAAPAEPRDARTIWILRDARPVPVRIRIGINDGTYTEVKEGNLAEGDAVILDVQGGPAQSAGGRLPRLF
jgi:HlyD family secretion protein